MKLVQFLCNTGVTVTHAQGRRAIFMGAVFKNSEKVEDPEAVVQSGDEIIVKTAGGGSRTFIAAAI